MDKKCGGWWIGCLTRYGKRGAKAFKRLETKKAGKNIPNFHEWPLQLISLINFLSAVVKAERTL